MYSIVAHFNNFDLFLSNQKSVTSEGVIDTLITYKNFSIPLFKKT